MRNILLNVIEKSRFYPSGDNAQPFNFDISENKIQIFHVRERAEHAFNPKNISSIFTLGCLIEAIAIAASEFQLEFDLNLDTENVSALLTFKKIESLKSDPLAQQLSSRITDRRPYLKDLDLNEVRLNLNKDNNLNKDHLHLLQNTMDKNFVKYMIQADNIMWSWKEAFFSISKFIQFKANKEMKLGLSPENLGLKKLDVLAIQLINRFPILFNIFSKLGMLSMTGKKLSIEVLKGSPAFLLVSMENNDLIQAGRQTLRAWIQLCSHGYALQPMSTAVLTPYTYYAGAGDTFPEKFKKFYENNKYFLAQMFGLKEGQQPIYMFRIGKAPSAFPEKMKISRLDVKDLILKHDQLLEQKKVS